MAVVAPGVDGGYYGGAGFFAFAIVIYVLLVIILRAGFWGY
ncbi:conserved hypothetical protein [[Clostridium] ultunense Esp]|nr:hypothetical protein [Thermicanus aegyptius]CCQ97266.1 conserved hypothetical protein [[Clostridium] ultunense Esp]